MATVPDGLPGKFIRLLALVITVFFCGWSVSFLLTNTDIWWHLTAGRYMATTHTFLDRDIFSVTAFNQTWINVHWLFQVAMYGIYAVGAEKGLVLFKAFLFALTGLVMLVTHYRKETMIWACLLTAWFCYSVRYYILARPTAVTLLLLAGEVFLIERFRANRQRLYLAGLIGLQVIWANVQSLFILGPVVLACYILGDLAVRLLKKKGWAVLGFEGPVPIETVKQMGLVLGGSVAACLVNPYGGRVFLVPFKIFIRILPSVDYAYSYLVSENVPLWMPAISQPTGFLKWLGLAGLISFIVNVRAFPVNRFLLFMAFLFLNTIAHRNIPLYVVVVVPIIIGNLNRAYGAGILKRLASLPARYLTILGTAALVLVVTAGGITIRANRKHDPRHPYQAPFKYPAAAARYLKQHPRPGNLFNSARHGGYLMWTLFPEKLCFMDGRFMLRSADFLNQYIAVLDHPERFNRYAWQHAISQVLVPISQRERYFNLACYLYQDPRWQLVHLDETAAVFSNLGSEQDKGLDLGASVFLENLIASIRQEYGDNDYVKCLAGQNLGNYLASIGCTDLARRISNTLMKP